MQIAGQDTELPEIRLRSKVFAAIVVSGLLLLAMRLFYLQVIRGDEIYRLTSESIVRTVVLPAPRGELRDRRGRVLATTRPSFDLVVHPGQLDRASYDQLVRRSWPPSGPICPSGAGWRPPAKGVRAEPVTFAEDITDEHMAAVATRMDLEGVVIRPEPRRRYPFGSLFTHTLGYTNEIRAEELKRRRPEGYRPQDRVGPHRPGAPVERYLRGQAGFEKAGGGSAQPTPARRERRRSGPRPGPARAGPGPQRDPDRGPGHPAGGRAGPARQGRGGGGDPGGRDRAHPGHVFAPGLRPQPDVRAADPRAAGPPDRRSPPPVPGQDRGRHLQPRLDLQGGDRRRRPRRGRDRPGRPHRLPGLDRAGQAEVPLHPRPRPGRRRARR